MPSNVGKNFLNQAKHAVINHGKKMMTVGSMVKGLGLFIGGDYVGSKIEKMTRPTDKRKLKKYMYEKPSTNEQLKHLGKVLALGFVPLIGDFSSGVYNGYITSRTKKR